MLYVALCFSLTILVAVCGFGYWSKSPRTDATIVLLVGLFPNCGMAFMPPVLLQCLLTAVGLYTLFGLLTRDRARRLFPPYAILAAVIAWGIALWNVSGCMERYDQLREELKYEPIRDRLPAPEPAIGSPTNLELLAAVERESDGDHRAGYRTRAITQLHEDHVQLFVDNPGFGATRMSFVPSEQALEQWRSGEGPIPQPGPPDSGGPGGGSRERYDMTINYSELARVHVNGITDFAPPESFGLRRADGQVAGFQPHGLTQTPDRVELWRVERVDLVGLVLAPEPRVYVSEFLPRMDHLKHAAARPPDEFETAALAGLRSGKELVVSEAEGTTVRAVGAIRSAKQCVDCHGGNRGDLLGAFSYTLGR